MAKHSRSKPTGQEPDFELIAQRLRLFADVAGPFGRWRRQVINGEPTGRLVRHFNNNVINNSVIKGHRQLQDRVLDPDTPHVLPTVDDNRPPIRQALGVYAMHQQRGERAGQLFENGAAQLLQAAADRVFGPDIDQVLELAIEHWAAIQSHLPGSPSLAGILTDIFDGFYPENGRSLVASMTNELETGLHRGEVAHELVRALGIGMHPDTASSARVGREMTRAGVYVERLDRALHPGRRSPAEPSRTQRESPHGPRLDRELALASNCQEAARADRERRAATCRRAVDLVRSEHAKLIGPLLEYQLLLGEQLVERDRMSGETLPRRLTKVERATHPDYASVRAMPTPDIKLRMAQIGREIAEQQILQSNECDEVRGRASGEWLRSRAEILAAPVVLPAVGAHRRGMRQTPLRVAVATAATTLVAATGVGVMRAMTEGNGEVVGGAGLTPRPSAGAPQNPAPRSQGQPGGPPVDRYIAAEGRRIGLERALRRENPALSPAGAREIVDNLRTDPHRAQQLALGELKGRTGATPVTVRVIAFAGARNMGNDLQPNWVSMGPYPPVSMVPSAAEEADAARQSSWVEWAASLEPGDNGYVELRSVARRDEIRADRGVAFRSEGFDANELQEAIIALAEGQGRGLPSSSGSLVG